MATKDLTPQLMKGEVWSVNGQRGAVTLPEPVNSLDSDSTTAPLAAAQGKALKGIAGGAVSTANEAKAGLDSKADKASNNFTTSLQLKGDGVATEAYVKTADVSGTKIDGKAIKTYIADAVKAGGSSAAKIRYGAKKSGGREVGNGYLLFSFSYSYSDNAHSCSGIMLQQLVNDSWVNLTWS